MDSRTKKPNEDKTSALSLTQAPTEVVESKTVDLTPDTSSTKPPNDGTNAQPKSAPVEQKIMDENITKPAGVSDTLEVPKVPGKDILNKRMAILSTIDDDIKRDIDFSAVKPLGFQEIDNSSGKHFEIKTTYAISEKSEILPAFVQCAKGGNVLNFSSASKHEYTDIDEVPEIVTDNVDHLCTASRELYSIGSLYVGLSPNPAFIEGSGLKFYHGVPVYDALFRELVSSEGKGYYSADKLRVASGFLMYALHFSINTNYVLRANSSEFIEIGENNVLTGRLAGLAHRKMLKNPGPHPVLAAANGGIKMIDAWLTRECPFIDYKYGRSSFLEATDQSKPIIEEHYLNIDQVTATALGITYNTLRRRENAFDRSDLERILEAYGLNGCSIRVPKSSMVTRKFGIKYTRQQELSALLFTAALRPEIENVIVLANLECFFNFGTLRTRLGNDILSEFDGRSNISIIMARLKDRRGMGNCAEALRYLVMQVSPILTWPSLPKDNAPSKDVALIIDMIEIALWFIFYPILSKYVGADLANRIYSLTESLNLREFNEFVANIGYDGTPGDNRPVTPHEYWNNVRVPAIFSNDARMAQRFNANRYPVLHFFRSVMFPQVTLLEHTAAHAADFPRATKRPQFPEMYGVYANGYVTGNNVKNAIMLMLENVLMLFDRLNRTNGALKYTLFSSMKASDLSSLLNKMMQRVKNYEIGFAREVGVPLAYLRNRKTNFLNAYCGQLGTPFPPQLAVGSKMYGFSHGYFPVDNRRGEQVELIPGVVWNLLLDLEFKSLDTPGVDAFDPVCLFIPPNPGYEFSKDEAIVDMCFDTVIPFGITAKIFESSGLDPTFDYIWKLTGGLPREKSFERILAEIQNAMSKTKLDYAIGTDKLYLHDTRTVALIDACVQISTGFNLRQINDQDIYPTSLKDLDIIPDGFMARFRVGLTAIADPLSDVSGLYRGFLILREDQRTESPDDYPVSPIQDWIHVRYSNRTFEYDREQEGLVLKMQINNVGYSNPSQIPHTILVMQETFILEEGEREFLREAIMNRRLGLKFPNMYYVARIEYCHATVRPDQYNLIDGLLNISESSIPAITFYDTRTVSQATQMRYSITRERIKLLWPLQRLQRSMISGPILSYDSQIYQEYEGPTSKMCDSGQIVNGTLIHTGGQMKDVRHVSLSNGVYNFTKLAELDGRIVYTYTPPAGHHLQA